MRVVLSVLVLAGAAAGLWGVSAYRHDIAAARIRIESGSLIAQSPCGPIEYASAGSGPPLLLIHGAGGGFDQGLAFGRGLPEAGIRIIAPSRFGYLRSPVPLDVTAETQADAHACLLEALGLDRVAVLGGSAGAPSAMQFCIRHPQRCERLILLVPAAYSPAHAVQMAPPPGVQFMFDHVLTQDPVFWLMATLVPRTLIGSILGTPGSVYDAATPADRALARQILAEILPVSQRRAGLLIDARVTSTLTEYALDRLTMPVLLITARDDRYGTYENARYTAERIPGSQLVVYETGGHLWLGHGPEVTRDIAAFVQARGPRTTPAAGPSPPP